MIFAFWCLEGHPGIKERKEKVQPVWVRDHKWKSKSINLREYFLWWHYWKSISCFLLSLEAAVFHSVLFSSCSPRLAFMMNTQNILHTEEPSKWIHQMMVFSPWCLHPSWISCCLHWFQLVSGALGVWPTFTTRLWQLIFFNPNQG